MPFIVFAMPIRPGETDRAVQFGDELTPELREEYERLNRDQNIRRHMEWVQRTPMGDLLLVLFESETPERMLRPFRDHAYDDWWRQRVQQVHGWDPAEIEAVFPEQTFEWTADEGAATGR
jgi:hypothetical protein